MGVRIIIKDVNYSLNSLGLVADKLPEMNERVKAYVTEFLKDQQDYVIKKEEVDALIYLDKKLSENNLYSKMRGIFPFIGKTSNQLGINLVNTEYSIYGLPYRNNKSDVYIPSGNINIPVDTSWYKNMGFIAYQNKPATSVPTSIKATLSLNHGCFVFWNYITEESISATAFQSSVYTASKIGFKDVDTILNKNEFLSFFAGDNGMTSYHNLSKSTANYNASYLDDESVLNGKKLIFGSPWGNNVLPLSFLAITTGDITDDEYQKLYDIIRSFLSNVGNL